MKDVISIIIPVYNASKYLNNCIESVLRQTYKELEIILINDGSTDESASICRKYQKKDKRICIINQENGGSVKARSAGLAIAAGKYIGFVDADDYIEPDMYENLYRKLREFDADFVCTGSIIGNKKNCDYKEELVDFSISNKKEFIYKSILQNNSSLWSKLFKAELIKNTYMSLPEEQSYGEDLLCLCKCILKSNKIYMYREAFYHYEIHNGSLSHRDWLDICLQESHLHDCMNRLLKENALFESCGEAERSRYRKCIIGAITEEKSGVINSVYRFPDIERLKGKKIVLYGAGKVGRDYYFQISKSGKGEIVAWVDKEKYERTNLIQICQPEALKDICCDVILLAVKSKSVAQEIKNELMQNCIYTNESKILWSEPVYLYEKI